MLTSAAACSGSSPSNTDAAPGIDSSVTPQLFTGQVFDSSTNDPITGAQFCISGLESTPQCTTTDDTGAYSLSIAYDTSQTYRTSELTTADGYLGNDFEVYETPGPADENSPALLLSTANATTLLATDAGFSFPTTTNGFVRLRTSDSDDSSITATIAPLASGTTGATAVYTDGSGVPDPALTSTGSAGGDIYFGDLAPGTYAITFSDGSAAQCSSPLSGPGSDAFSIEVNVYADAVTVVVDVFCGSD